MLALLLMVTLSTADAQTPWLTVMGDPSNAETDTIQVDPMPVSVSGNHRTLRVRVSRSSQRTNWDGIPYRSYESTVLFDCANNTARYLEIRFYLQPGWTGDVHRHVTYPESMPRWMAFGGVEPNPYQRILTAACSAKARR